MSEAVLYFKLITCLALTLADFAVSIFNSIVLRNFFTQIEGACVNTKEVQEIPEILSEEGKRGY